MAKVTIRSPYNVRCSYSTKQLVSEIGTWEKMSWACFWKLIMQVRNECPVGDCSRRPDQPHKMPGCRVVALFWVRPNHHEQRNGEQKCWEQSKLGCTAGWDTLCQSVRFRGIRNDLTDKLVAAYISDPPPIDAASPPKDGIAVQDGRIATPGAGGLGEQPKRRRRGRIPTGVPAPIDDRAPMYYIFVASADFGLHPCSRTFCRYSVLFTPVIHWLLLICRPRRGEMLSWHS